MKGLVNCVKCGASAYNVLVTTMPNSSLFFVLSGWDRTREAYIVCD